VEYKILIIGDARVGKSSLLSRFSDNTFTDSFIATIGAQYMIKTMNMNGALVKLKIWDTAGQVRFRTRNAPTHDRGPQGLMVVYDVTNPDSFGIIRNWLQEVNFLINENTQKILVGNKCDLVSERIVSYDDAKELADELGLMFLETSAKDSTNVNMVFEQMAKKILENN